MSEVETQVDTDATDVADDTTATDSPEITIDDYNKAKESLDKATSNYVLP